MNERRPEIDVVLRPLAPGDAAALLDLERRNRGYWRAAGPLRDDGWFTHTTQRLRLEREARDRKQGCGLALGVFAADTLAGRLALSNVVRGPFQNAYLGYAIDERHAGRGIGTVAVEQALAVAWAEGLHRVQAPVSPDKRHPGACSRRPAFVTRASRCATCASTAAGPTRSCGRSRSRTPSKGTPRQDRRSRREPSGSAG